MKPDKLEKYIIDHAHEFDAEEPADELWNAVHDRLRPVRKVNWKKTILQVAAAIAIFIGSWIIHDLVKVENGGNDSVAGEQVVGQVDERMQMLMEAEVFYTSKINTAKEEIYQLSGNDDHLMEVLNFDLEELEEIFEELKNDLKDDSDNQEVIGAMIQNYRIKLGILEEMLLQMKKMNNSDSNENQKGYEL